MTDRKLYALTDEQAGIVAGLANAGAAINSSTGDADNAQRFRDLADALTPLEVNGADLMDTFENHMILSSTGGAWVCDECGHRYSGRISKPEAWGHAAAATLEELLQGNK